MVCAPARRSEQRRLTSARTEGKAEESDLLSVLEFEDEVLELEHQNTVICLFCIAAGQLWTCLSALPVAFAAELEFSHAASSALPLWLAFFHRVRLVGSV